MLKNQLCKIKPSRSFYVMNKFTVHCLRMKRTRESNPWSQRNKMQKGVCKNCNKWHFKAKMITLELHGKNQTAFWGQIRHQGLPVVTSAVLISHLKHHTLTCSHFVLGVMQFFETLPGWHVSSAEKKTRWMIGLDYSITIKLFFYYKYVVQTFSVIYNKVAFLIWIEIWVAREVCMQNKLLYPMCLQGQ